MSTEPTPGWTLDRPFDLADSLADLGRAAQHAADLARADDGSGAQAKALREARAVVRRLSVRIERHRAPGGG
ncbi:hypothetical protein [Kitasatospora sp. MBT63]|uniref:hypothetical protein n=1 Tax=Kitasatospora sp. MBT63 TaxID=1444768 RepID=UPI00053A0113|nr:hypothetical protein [Kitasatospora sp. MBT63]